MNRNQMIVVLTLASNVASWALSKIVDSLTWLPYVTLAVSVSIILLLVAFVFLDWRNTNRRQSMPGFAIHFVARIGDTNRGRRRYLMDYTKPSAPGACIYLSSTERFVFTVTDSSGEPYSIETPTGPLGFPIAHVAYFGIEAGTNLRTTEMRALLNGKVVTQRTIPFAIDFGSMNLQGGIVGANRDGKDKASFQLYESVIRDKTLDYREQLQLTQYFRDKFNIES